MKPSAVVKAPEPMHGRCPCCNAILLVDARRRFGIMACPECARIIWWVTSLEAEAPFFSDDFKHPSLEDLLENGTDSFDGTGVDSLDAVELVMALEEEVGHEIPDEDAKKLKSVKDVIEYIRKHRKK